MTKEEKQVLLKDLSARLPYGVIVQYKGHNTIIKNKVLTGSDLDCNMEYYKPYLRSMSSMTEEEEVIFEQLIKDIHYKSRPSTALRLIDWLDKNMFDHRGLISKGLAIEVTSDNNPYN